MRSSCSVIKSSEESNEQYLISPIPLSIVTNNIMEEAQGINYTANPAVIDVLVKEQDKIKEVDDEAKKAADTIIKSAQEKSREILKEAKENSDILKKETLKNAENIINDANKKGKDILKEAKEGGYQEGYKKGYTEGYQKGEDESKSNYENLIKSGNEYVYSIKSEVDKYVEKTKSRIIELSVEIARKIIKTDISVNQEAIFKIAEKVISSAVDRKQIILRVNPEDYKILKSRKDELDIYVEKSDDLFLAADERIQKGSIKAETQSGFVDGDIEVQLQNMLKSLTGEE